MNFCWFLFIPLVLLSVMAPEPQSDADEYRRLIGKIGGNKSYLTTICNDLGKYIEAETLDEEKLEEAEVQKEKIEDRLRILQGLFDELLGNTSLTGDYITEYDSYIKGIESKLIKLKLKIKDCKVTVSPISPKNESIVLEKSVCDNAIKYPELTLPKFSGGPNGIREFRPFYQLFKELVEDKPDIPDIYKVQYLRESLPEGSEARRLISHIPPLAENYQLIMALLMSRYYDQTGEAYRLRRELMSISNWSVCKSVEAQRKLVDHVVQYMALLRQVDEVTPENMSYLVLHIIAILPERLKFEVQRLKKEERTVEAVIELVENNISSRLEVNAFSDSSSRSSKSSGHDRQPQRQYSSNSRFHSFHSSGASPSGSDSRPCLYCKEVGHSPHDCRKLSKESRAEIVSGERRCWNCLSKEHQVKGCKVGSRCDCKKGKHSSSLCSVTPPWRLGRNSGRKSSGSTGAVKVASLCSEDESGARYLSTVVVEVTGKDGRPVKLRLLLDGCATHSYGLQSSLRQLPVASSGRKVELHVSTFSGLRKIASQMVTLDLPGGVSINVVMTDQICEPLRGHRVDDECQDELKGYQLADPACITEQPLPIDILVGVDNYWKVITDENVRLKSGLVIMSTVYGWALSGELMAGGQGGHSGTLIAHTLLTSCWRDSTHYGLSAHDSWYKSPVQALCGESRVVSEAREDEECDCDKEDVLCELVKFWDLDTLGIKPDLEISPVLEAFQQTLSYDAVTQRYTVRLPIKPNIEHLVSNFNCSRRRLDSLFAKFRRPGNETFARKYTAVIQEQLAEGIIERVALSDDEREDLEKNVSRPVGSFYIPHHGVKKQRSEKVRVVMDASAHAFKGALSLNQCLMVGPSLLNLLAEVLLTFRLHNVVLIADIIKAFLMIGVAEEDRDYLRFLWYDQEGNLEVYRFTRVPFGTGASSFLLNATLRHHLEKVVEDQSLLQLLLKGLYVDDVLTGGDTVAFVLKLKELLCEIFGSAAMELHGWNSNSPEVRKELGIEGEDDETFVLGVQYNRARDDIGLNLEKVMKNTRGSLSKRELLRSTAQFYDPHGWINPVVLIPKLLFQKVCSRKLSWDDPLPEEIAERYTEFRSQLSFLERVKVQRHILLPNYDRVELHGFSDASQSAYAAAIYLKSSCGGVSTCHLLECKNRVAPQKKLSIPRLELMGAVLLARLMAVVVACLKGIKIDLVVYYTDSMNVLYWIRTEHKMWSVFVACRIKEVNSLSNFADWKFVRTDSNPADVATRGLMPSEILDHKLFFHGPEFLISGRTESEIDASHPPTECLRERKKVVQLVVPVIKGIRSVIKMEEFSSLQKLLARTVIILRFVYGFARTYLKDKGDRFADLSIPEFYAVARQKWIRSVQSDSYHQEIRFCSNNIAEIPSGMKIPTSVLRSLNLFLDPQGILRTRTRLQEAMIDDSVKYPILLPKDSHFTKLLVLDTHRRLCHSGVRQVMSSIRAYYWIPHCRRMVSKIIRSCFNCRRVDASFYPVPDPPPLPDFRVARVDAFDNIGVDHCGPFYVREGRKTPSKCYVLIFTCAVSRGVHLELVDTMSTQDFMLGFRKFVSRRGLPSFILSDNSKTFKCASKELTTILNDPKMQYYLNGRNIRWQRYLEYAPWWGGWIEVLNRVFKSSIRKVIGGAYVSFQELTCLLAEAEAIVNSRPISYVYDSVHEGQAITPSLLICGKDLTQLPPDMSKYRFDRKLPQVCRERMKFLEKLKSYFWTRWTREYMTELSDVHARRRKGKEVREPKVDDVVLVKEGSDTVKIPRHKWRIGRISKVYPGRDDVIRSVDVIIVNPEEGKPALLRQKSPRHLVPLESED